MAGGIVAALTILFHYTRTGLAFRAAAEDQYAALNTGLRLNVIWAAVWAIAGFVALVAGLLWGASTGVQFSLSLVVLKSLPWPADASACPRPGPSRARRSSPCR